MNCDTQALLSGLAFPEAPRWRENRLWFTDQHARKIITVDLDGKSQCILETEDLPGGLGWLPDGTLLVVGMTQRKVYRLENKKLVCHADLSDIANFHCNDLLVDHAGRAYVGNFGYDLHRGGAPVPGKLAMIEPSGRTQVAAEGLIFANGMVITPDQKTLIVAETFASRLTAFRIGDEGLLADASVWADLGEASPDGICLDAEGAIWVASPTTKEVIRVALGGTVLARIHPIGVPYACMLGGADRQTLFILSSETDDPAQAKALQSGRIEVIEVSAPGVGLP